jgi:hypothetical protein
LLRESSRPTEPYPGVLESLNEKEYYINDLNDAEQDSLYQEFKNSYTKATGAAFTRDAFTWRADNWTFFGDPPDARNQNALIGGIAVRKQLSNGMMKLVASFGNFRSILRGFDELNAKHTNAPIWGFLTPDLAKMITRHSKFYKTVPGLVVKAMEGMIKKMSNGEVKSVGLDGSIMMDTPAGVMAKQMIGNLSYFHWLIDSVEDPANASRLPVPQMVLSPLMGLVKKVIGISD